jgi:vacuolar-type H+-ATPase subunit I/STV1
MKIAFHILAILAFGVAGYFSLTHKEKFEQQQTTRLETIETNRNVTASADAEDANIVTRQAVLDTAVQDRDTANAALESLTATNRTLNNELSTVTSTLEAQQVELTELNNALEEVRKIVAELGDDVTLDNMGDKIQELSDERDNRISRNEELTELVGGAERTLADRRDEAERLVQRNVARNTRLSRNATEAVLTAVDQSWGFVVIGAGSNSGFAPQTTLIVKRDGRMIGRVKPSSIEPTQTIAEIEYESLAPGVRLQPGDRVMLAQPSAN